MAQFSGPIPIEATQPTASWVVTTASDITNTTAVTLKAAETAARHFITTLSVSNTHSSVNTRVDILSGTTVVFSIPAAANCGGAVLSLAVPLGIDTNADLKAQCATTGAAVRVSLIGYTLRY